MRKLIWVAVILLVSVAPAMAQVRARASVFVAGSFVAGSREFLMNSNNAVRTEYANSGKFGFRVGADLNRNWAAEAAYSYGGNNLRAINLNPPRREREFETKVHQFLMNGSYYLADSDQNWRPSSGSVARGRSGDCRQLENYSEKNSLDWCGPCRFLSIQ